MTRTAKNRSYTLVLRQSKQLTRDPSTVYMFVARDLEKILILYDFFFFILGAFVRFHDFFLLADPLISTRDREE